MFKLQLFASNNRNGFNRHGTWILFLFFILFLQNLYWWPVLVVPLFDVQFIRMLDNVFSRVNEREIHVFIEKPVLHCQSALSSTSSQFTMDIISEKCITKTERHNKKFRTNKLKRKPYKAERNGNFLASNVNCSNQTFLIRKSTCYHA